MKAILISILCAMSTLLSAQTIDFDKVTFTKYATVMSENDLSNPSALRNVHNGKFTVYIVTDDKHSVITIANVTSGDLGIESIVPESDISTSGLDICVVDNYKTASNDGSTILLHGMLFWDFICIVGASESIEEVEEMAEKVEHIYVALHYASETDTTPDLMAIYVGNVNTYPFTVFFNDSTDDSANRPSQGIKSSATSGTLNGHEWVDLGLPSGTKWATCNIGANDYTELGDYFAYGETSPKKTYSYENHAYTKHENDVSYNLTKKELPYTISNTAHDAAYINWGKGWRMPTKTEFLELYSKCKVTRVGNLLKFTGPNGNHIYLNTGGYRFFDRCLHLNKYCIYWTSSNVNNNMSIPKVFSINEKNTDAEIDLSPYVGCLIRPVSDKSH